MKIVLIGAGQRGRIYADAAVARGLAEIAAVAEPDDARREAARTALGVPAEMCFDSSDKLFSLGKIADAAVIASMDRDHFDQTMQALALGYDILLEKPISPDPAQCLAIAKRAQALGRTVVVCHVLRYTPFYSTLKQILDSGELGKIISIQHNENVGNFHIAHDLAKILPRYGPSHLAYGQRGRIRRLLWRPALLPPGKCPGRGGGPVL